MTPQDKNRITILVIFAMTIVPFLIALALKSNPEFLGSRQTNYGQLVSPAIPTDRADLSGFDAFSQKNMSELPGHWLITNIIPEQHCNEICLDAVLKTKQLRVMLNKELMRTRRVIVLMNEVDAQQAQQWWLKDSLMWRLQNTEGKSKTDLDADNLKHQQLLHEQNKLDDALINRLIGKDNREFAMNSDLIRVKPNAVLRDKLLELNNGKIQDGSLLLLDPLGNIMMKYDPGFDPYKVKNDLMHLLRTSQLG